MDRPILVFWPYPNDYYHRFPFLPMARIHFSALSDRWSSAFNNDALITEKIGNYHLFGVAEGLSDLPGPASASGIAISSLVGAVREMKGSPASALNDALHRSEAQIYKRKAESPDLSRDATHLSACIIDDSLDCTILDTGEGNTLLAGKNGIYIPRNYPKATIQKDPDFLSPGSGSGKSLGDMISHTLGEPHLLRPADFIRVNIGDLFMVISSGGLHDFVKKEVIGEIVQRNGENVETSSEQLMQEAQRAGSERTITVIVVHGHVNGKS